MRNKIKHSFLLTILLGILIPPIANGQQPTAKTRAVIIGISDYQDPAIPDLQFADKDAEAFAQFLQSTAGGNVPAEQMIVLKNEKATNARIADALIWMLEESKPKDQAIIYFSGHGDVETITRFNRGYLLTYDSPPKIYMAGAFNIRDLQDIISTMSNNHVQVVMISDACRAGKLAGSDVGGTEATAQNLSKQFANEVKILSCQPNEFSLEGEQWGGGRGAFSFHLLDGLKGLADKNEDFEVNLFEIGRYLEDRVPEETAPHKQMPFTVGDRNASVAFIDEPTLALLKEQKATEQPTLAQIETKGMETLLLAKVDSNIVEMYNDFIAAVNSKQLLEPAGTSAYDLYQKLAREESIADLHNIMRRNLSVALQEDAQQAVNAYLAANPTELQRRYESEEDYSLYPRYLKKAAELLGEKHFYYTNLMAKLHYFEGLKFRLDADTRGNSGGWQLAIEQQLKALAYQQHSPYVLNELGVLHTRLKLDEEAFEYYKKAIDLAPEWGLPYANYSIGLHYSGQQEKAIEYGEKAMQLMNDFPNIYNYMAWLYSESYSFYDKSNWSRRGVELQDNFYFEWDLVSSEAQRRKRYAKSVELLKQVIELEPGYMVAYNNLAQVYFQTREVEKVKPILKEALRRDSSNHMTYRHLSEYYKWMGQFEVSEFYIKKLKTKFPDIYRHSALLDGMLGNLYRESGKDELAIQSLNEALRFDNNSSWVNFILRDLYLRNKDYKNAVKHLLKALEHAKAPDNFRIGALNMAGLNFDEEAEFLFQKAIQIKPDFIKAYTDAAYFYKVRGNFKKANEMYNEMLRIAPEDPFTLSQLGISHYLNKDFQKAHQYIAKAVSIDPNSLEGYNSASWFYWMHGDYTTAEKYALQAFEVNYKGDRGKRFDRYWHLAWIYFDTGRLAEALAALEKGKKEFPGERRIYEGLFYFNAFSREYNACRKFSEQHSDILTEAPEVVKALDLIQQKEFKKAIAVLEKSFETFRWGINRKYLLMQLNAQIGNTEKALEWMKGLPHTHFSYRFFDSDQLLSPLKKLPAYHQMMQRHFPDKYKDDELLPIEPQAPPVYYADHYVLMGCVYRNNGQTEKALAYFDKALAMETDTLSSAGAVILANYYLGLNQFDKAKAVMPAKVYSDIPGELWTAARLNYFFYGADSATPYFEKYIAITKRETPHNRVGVFFIKNGEFELAKTYLKKGKALAPDKMYLYRNLARNYFFHGKKEAAFKELKESLELDPLDPATKAANCMLSYYDRPQKAKALFEEAGFLSVWECLELMRNNQYVAADKAWEHLQKTNTQWWMEFAKYKYMQMKIRQGETESALKVFKELLAKGTFVNYQLYKTDKELDPIRDSDDFKGLMRKYFPEK